MPHPEKQSELATNYRWLKRKKKDALVFHGFEALKSNVVYCPNQLFDVCVPHYSRGVVRLVSYMIRQTLGWCDADGNPQNEERKFTYSDFVHNAGISRGLIRKTLDEALSGNFITCVQEGKASRAHAQALPAIYSLKWDDESEYIKDPKQFKGFYGLDGNRTNIPNQFFDIVVPNETLSVIKVVSSITRFSIGFLASRGARRQRVSLAYRDIKNYTKIKSNDDVRGGIKRALESNYITLVMPGHFDPGGKESKAAMYALKWVDTTIYPVTSSKSGAENVEEQSQSDVGGLVQNPVRGIGSKSGAEPVQNPVRNRFKIRCGIQITTLNNTNKQQQEDVAVDQKSYERLKEIGFDEKTATALSSVRSLEHIEKQIAWLPRRNPQNRLAMLRRAIEENWSEPADLSVMPRDEHAPAVIFAKYFYAGWGINTGEPTVEPSRSDVAGAEHYVKELLKVWPDPSRLSKWGRNFGKFCRENQGKHTQIIVSLAVMIRTHGDRFAGKLRHARKDTLKQAEITARSKHKAKHNLAWMRYVGEKEEQMNQEQPVEYGVFQDSRDQKLADIQKSQFGQNMIEKSVEIFNSDENRLEEFQGFFSEGVLDFWRWNEAFNQHSKECQSSDII